MLESLADILVRRDNMTRAEALQCVAQARLDILEGMEEGEDPEDMLAEIFGLEPDYLMDEDLNIWGVV